MERTTNHPLSSFVVLTAAEWPKMFQVCKNALMVICPFRTAFIILQIRKILIAVSRCSVIWIGGGEPMTRAEREATPGESFDGGYHLYAQEKHRERVAKNPDRIAYAIEQFKAHGIEFQLKNEQTGHFHCWRKSDDKLFQFYAGTGKIQGFSQVRGIHALITMLEG